MPKVLLGLKWYHTTQLSSSSSSELLKLSSAKVSRDFAELLFVLLKWTGQGPGFYQCPGIKGIAPVVPAAGNSPGPWGCSHNPGGCPGRAAGEEVVMLVPMMMLLSSCCLQLCWQSRRAQS